MKKISFILFAVVLTFCLLGCEVSETSKPILKDESDNNVCIWTDKETGVQYFIYRYDSRYGGMGGITPRLNADGTLYRVPESEDTE